MSYYDRDLAFIHDDGFGMIARGAAATLLDALALTGKRDGVVVELACGSGISSRILADAGYDVRGFDISASMVELARERVPEARFAAVSLYDAPIEPCVAVTAIGEAFNYLFDPRAGFEAMRGVFERTHEALVPGGLLIFDLAQPGRGLPRVEQTTFTGPGWRVSSAVTEDPARRRLLRRIVSHREVAGLERTDEEIHELALYDPEEVFAALSETGFRPRILATYAGHYNFSLGHGGFLATRV